MILTAKNNGDFTPHPEGIHQAICCDIVDLGLEETQFQGNRRMVNRVRLLFESEQTRQDGRPFLVCKTFTATIHPKSRLAEFIGKWRGRPVLPGESLDLSKLVGRSATLVISHQQNLAGRTYASIDAISKPTKELALSGTYDPVAARQRIAEWRGRQIPNCPPPAAPPPAASDDTDVPF